MNSSQLQFSTDDPLLDTKQVAALIGSTPQFVEKRRTQGDGPEFLKIGRLVRYRKSVIDRWLSARTAKSTDEARRARANKAA